MAEQNPDLSCATAEKDGGVCLFGVDWPSRLPEDPVWRCRRYGVGDSSLVNGC